MNLSVLSMGLIPLTWAYAITRYRLMDVDIIFQQGYVYTLATLAVIGTFYGLIFLIFNTQTITPPAFVVLISFATFVFQPIRRGSRSSWTAGCFTAIATTRAVSLIEFARELSSETDQNAMLAKVSDRLLRTLSIQQVGFFLLDEKVGPSSGCIRLRRADHGSRYGKRPERLKAANSICVSSRSVEARIFSSNGPNICAISFPRVAAIGTRNHCCELDFTYYVACKSRGRTIAFFGVSRTTEGDFLSSDDIELLVTLSGYVAIAIENSRLYSSLQRKVEEYERLKEFSENIVESINVGILAADLDDRVESWNTQIERLTGIRARTRSGAVWRIVPRRACARSSTKCAATTASTTFTKFGSSGG